jgi:EAL domain-containing protein (putative c-di-GMP-specific phosphodiesterase class I)
LAEDKLELRYQPIVDIETQRIVAAEALLRWNHPDFGWVSPETFVPIAEESGLIVPLGEWVLRAACREAATWPTEISLSVNLSAAQLKSQGLVPTIVRALASTGLAARRLELEMTETVLFEENVALDVMNTLRTLGVRFSLDDFGTGYSSLSYLRRFRFDQIKIDKSFLRDGSDRPDGEAILHAIGGLGRTLGIETVAEGIETPAELAVVRAAGCVYGQGYLFGKPMPPQDLAARLFDQGTSELSTGPDGEIDAHGDLVMRPVREAIARAG